MKSETHCFVDFFELEKTERKHRFIVTLYSQVTGHETDENEYATVFGLDITLHDENLTMLQFL